jgi:hypothetical protein
MRWYLKWFLKNKNIYYFDTLKMKSTLKNNHNHTPKQADLMFFKVFFYFKIY